MCEQAKNPETFYNYIGNFIGYKDELLTEYAFDNKKVAEKRMLKSWDWKPNQIFRYPSIN